MRIPCSDVEGVGQVGIPIQVEASGVLGDKLYVALAGAAVLHLIGALIGPGDPTGALAASSSRPTEALHPIELEFIRSPTRSPGTGMVRDGEVAASVPPSTAQASLRAERVPIAPLSDADLSRAPEADRTEDAAPSPNAADESPSDAPSERSADPPDVGWTDLPAQAARSWGLGASIVAPIIPLSASTRLSPAPTQPPARRPLTEEAIEGGIRSAMRLRDESLGLGGQERSIVTAAVKVAARSAPVPSGTRVRFEIHLDATGNIVGARVAQFSGGSTRIWAEVLSAIRAALAGPIALGVDARVAGVRLLVDAQILLVLPSGSIDGKSVGECIPMPHDGPSRGMFPSRDFFSVGGSQYGDRPSGTCTYVENPTAKRHLEVRTATRSIFPDAAPPPASSMPKPKKLLPWIEQ